MDQEKSYGYEIHTLDRMIGRTLFQTFEKLNISKMQSWIIHYLYDRPDENVYQKDLESFFHIARSTATGLLQGMEKQGYVIRCSVPGDARLKRIVLTEKGSDIQNAVLNALHRNEQALRQGISQEDLDTFYRVLCTMKNTMEAELSACSKTNEET